MTLKSFLIKTLIDSIVILVCAYLLSGVHVDGFGYAILVALALALLNQVLKPLLVILTIPATIVTFGLFLLVINALIIQLADWLVSGFTVDGFWWAVLYSLLLTFVKSLVNTLFKDDSSPENQA